MQKRENLVVGALCAACTVAFPATAGRAVTLQWTFNGVAGDSYSLRAGDTVTVGLRAVWSSPEPTAFGALVGADISITGDTGTSRSDAVSNVTRVAPYNFGPSGLAGATVSDADRFSITGVGPAQNQFSDATWDFNSPTDVMWQFNFRAGPGQQPRTIMLDIESLDNVLLFVQPFEPAIIVPAESVLVRQGFIHVPAPAATTVIAIIGLVGRRRRSRCGVLRGGLAGRINSVAS